MYKAGCLAAAMCLAAASLAGCAANSEMSREISGVGSEETGKSARDEKEDPGNSTEENLEKEAFGTEAPDAGEISEKEIPWVIDTASGPSRKMEAEEDESNRGKHYTHSAGKVFQNMEFTYEEVEERRTFYSR